MTSDMSSEVIFTSGGNLGKSWAKNPLSNSAPSSPAILPLGRRRSLRPLQSGRPAGLAPVGPWRGAACAAMSRRSHSSSDPEPAAIPARWRRSFASLSTTGRGTKLAGEFGCPGKWSPPSPKSVRRRPRIPTAHRVPAMPCRHCTADSESRQANATAPDTLCTLLRSRSVPPAQAALADNLPRAKTPQGALT